MSNTQLQSKLKVILYDKDTLEAAVAAIPLDENVTGEFVKTLVANFLRQHPAANPAYFIEKDEAYKLGQFTGDVDIINSYFKAYLIPEKSMKSRYDLPESVKEAMLKLPNNPTPQLN